MRTYVPVLVRGAEGEGVKLWGFGKQVYTELLGFITDPDYKSVVSSRKLPNEILFLPFAQLATAAMGRGGL